MSKIIRKEKDVFDVKFMDSPSQKWLLAVGAEFGVSNSRWITILGFTFTFYDGEMK